MDSTANAVTAAQTEEREDAFFGGTASLQAMSERLYLDSRRYDGTVTGGEIWTI